jgi:hypothetical protein
LEVALTNRHRTALHHRSDSWTQSSALPRVDLPYVRHNRPAFHGRPRPSVESRITQPRRLARMYLHIPAVEAASSVALPGQGPAPKGLRDVRSDATGVIITGPLMRYPGGCEGTCNG